MSSPAAAIAWEFRSRHRWGFVALAAYFVALAIIRFLALHGERVTYTNDESFAFVVITPLTATFIYFLAVFSFGVSGDLAARQSIYPARMFTLPVTTGALAGWPMLYGALAASLLWFATRFLGLWPSGSEVPIVWPALLGASLLAWTQALTWMPYPLPGLRVIVTVVWLASIDVIVLTALNLKATEPVMLAVLAPNLPLAYVVARFAVGRARRGDIPDWGRHVVDSSVAVANFRSSWQAVGWFEWRQHGRSLPSLVAIVLPFELSLLFVFRNYPNIIFEILLLTLFTPWAMAIFVAATVSYGMTPFMTTRPLSDAAFIAAKLRATMRSTLATWLLVIVAIAVAAWFSGTAPLLIQKARQLNDFFGAPRAAALLALSLAALIGSTWKQLVQSLYIGISGREWLVKASVFVALSLLAIALPLGHWAMSKHVVLAALWNQLPLMMAILVAFKLGAAGWIAVRLCNRGLVSDQTLLAGALVWDLLVFAVFALLAWIIPAMLMPRYVLVLIAMLAVPLVRISAAPLALAWNRHR